MVRPLSTALSCVQVFIPGGSVKYYDGSSRSPASWRHKEEIGERVHIEVASDMKGELQGEKRMDPSSLSLQLLCAQAEGDNKRLKPSWIHLS